MEFTYFEHYYYEAERFIKVPENPCHHVLTFASMAALIERVGTEWQLPMWLFGRVVRQTRGSANSKTNFPL